MFCWILSTRYSPFMRALHLTSTPPIHSQKLSFLWFLWLVYKIRWFEISSGSVFYSNYDDYRARTHNQRQALSVRESLNVFICCFLLLDRYALHWVISFLSNLFIYSTEDQISLHEVQWFIIRLFFMLFREGWFLKDAFKIIPTCLWIMWNEMRKAILWQ